jgi:hypothetical protein
MLLTHPAWIKGGKGRKPKENATRLPGGADKEAQAHPGGDDDGRLGTTLGTVAMLFKPKGENSLPQLITFSLLLVILVEGAILGEDFLQGHLENLLFGVALAVSVNQSPIPKVAELLITCIRVGHAL